MKQAQSETARYDALDRPRPREEAMSYGRRQTNGYIAIKPRVVEDSGSWFWAELCLSLLGTLWYAVTVPFRLVFWTIAWVGRLTALLLGFCFMVVGIALGAGPLFFLGIPLFLVGLVLTLKSLD